MSRLQLDLIEMWAVPDLRMTSHDGFCRFFGFFFYFNFLFLFVEDLSPAFFPTSDMWTTHPALAYSAAAAAAAAAAAELPGAALQHAALAVHPALHPQLPVRFFHQLHHQLHNQQQPQLP